MIPTFTRLNKSGRSVPRMRGDDPYGMTLRTYKDVAATPYFMKLYGFPMDV